MDTSSRRPLGRTGLTVEPLGFGAFKIGRNTGTKYADAYALPTDAEASRILNEILDLGIDLVDTAPAYGTSEETIGRSISHRRDEYVLATKVGEDFTDGRSRYDFSASAIDRSIDRSLRRLRTDRLDVVSVHSDGRDLEIVDGGETLEALRRRREAGDVRAICFSGKTVEGHRAAMRTGLVDCLMVEFHEADDSHLEVISEAATLGLGVMIKKGLASGRLPPARAIPFCLAPPGVSTVVVGSLTPKHIAENLAIAQATGRSA